MKNVMPKQHIPIFVSSTYEDMKGYRRVVRDSLHQMESIAKRMEFFGHTEIILIQNDRTLDISNVEWYPIAISGLLPPSSTTDQLFERIQVQDTLRRCVQKA